MPLALIAGVALFETRAAPVAAVPPAPTVTVASPLSRQIAEWDDYSGRFEASNSVDLRPRVSGEVIAVLSDGAVVRRGQLLFTIDPRRSLPLGGGSRRRDGARSDLSRRRPIMAGRNGWSRRARCRSATSTGCARASRRPPRARRRPGAGPAASPRRRLHEGPRADLGRISDRRVDAATSSRAAAAAPRAAADHDQRARPGLFHFDASEALFLKARRARGSGAASSAVEIRLQDETDYRWHGRLDFADNGLDQRSGTIRLRAVVSNPTQFLTPGMFGNMRLSCAPRRPWRCSSPTRRFRPTRHARW